MLSNLFTEVKNHLQSLINSSTGSLGQYKIREMHEDKSGRIILIYLDEIKEGESTVSSRVISCDINFAFISTIKTQDEQNRQLDAIDEVIDSFEFQKMNSEVWLRSRGVRVKYVGDEKALVHLVSLSFEGEFN